MSKKNSPASGRKQAERHNQQGLQAYAEWDIEEAVKQFQAATRAIPDEPEYHLNLARALSRAGDFDKALHALAAFLRLEPESELAERFERLFASGLDEVETILTDRMSAANVPIEVIGVAIQMWLEYRIAIGRESLVKRKPEGWAAALDYTARKVNLHAAGQREVASLYGVSPRVLRDRFENLVTTLDVMPCDYRYFVSDENPLDKLVEAAELLERLEMQFREP